MKNSNAVANIAIFLILALWIYSFFFVPTFDLDESLYRRVAEEMKWNGDYWHPVWDGKPLHHKPPLFYWLIVFFSKLMDGTQNGVSIFAARLPGFFATLGILFSLGHARGNTRTSIQNAFLVWGCTLFPLLTSTSVLFDPMQTLAMMPCLLIPHRAFSENREIEGREYAFIALGMFAGTALKGLTGLILPSLALAIHVFISDYRALFRQGWKLFSFSFVPACLASLAYYGYLDFRMGRAFTEEFFLVHHLGRGTQAMEAHHGPFYYYFGIVLLGGGFLVPLLWTHAIRTRFSYRKWGFPLSFALATLLFFSVSATKLPHYTWPLWPALALQLLTLQEQPSSERKTFESSWRIFLFPMVMLGGVLFWLAIHPDLMRPAEVTVTDIFFLSTAAALSWIGTFLFRRFFRRLEMISAISVMIALFMAIPIAGIAERILVTPFFEVARALKTQNPKPTECIRDSGSMTATLSLALGKELGREYTHNRCEPGEMRYLIAPRAKREECAERKMSVIHEGTTLILCHKI